MVNLASRRMLRYLLLPPEVTSFEREHLRRMMAIARRLFWAGVPALAAVAWLAGTSVLAALVLASLVAIGPTLASWALRSRPRLEAYVAACAAMVFSGVLVFVGRGELQIEMHFAFFVSLTLLVVLANPTVIVVAATTATLHHLILWLWLPYAVFNHDASIWTVVVHASFVALASISACFVSRKFFDNVIGLERVVQRRTRALHDRNHDMAIILDNVSQGLLTVSTEGYLGGEQSRSMTRWFGTPSAAEPFWSYVAGHDPDLEAWIQLCFLQLHDGVLPPSTAIAQLPTRVDRDGRSFRIEYRPFGAPIAGLLVVFSDITAALENERGERSQRDLIAMVERAYRDQAGFTESLQELDTLVDTCLSLNGDQPGALEVLRRSLHTLKGNAALLRVLSVAEHCHDLETLIEETQCFPPDAPLQELGMLWSSLHERLDHLLGMSRGKTLIVDWSEYQAVLTQIVPPEPSWALPIRRWGQTPTKSYLGRFAEQAQQLAQRLGKEELEIEVQDHEVYLDSGQFSAVWAALVHAIRNAVDHGIEPAAQREAAGKPAHGALRLSTELIGAALVISIADDGRGIDWDKVKARAHERGLPTATQADLEQALFAPGLSTSSRVSAVSGRGIGMSALREAVLEAGGSLELRSTCGRGTTLTCRLPMPVLARTAHGRQTLIPARSEA